MPGVFETHAGKTAPEAPWMRALFDAFDDAIFLHDSDGHILEANPAACRRLGYTRDELLRLNTRDIDDPAFAAGFKDRLEAQLATKRFRCEGRHRTKDGRLIPVDINTSVIQVQGKPVVLAVMRDMTELKAAEEALRDSESLYHSLVDCLPQNIFRKDRHGRVTFANKRYCETLSRSFAEVLGKTDYDLFPPHLAAKYVEDDRRVMASGRFFEAVEEHRTPDGERLFVEVMKTPTYDAQGEVTGIQGIFWDVTERKLADERLAESERRYRQLAEATLDGVLLTDDNGTVRLFNPAAERMFGYKAEEVVGQNVRLIIPETYQMLHDRGLRRFVETRQGRYIGRTMEVQGLRKDGSEFPVEIALSVVSAGGGAPLQFLGALRDLSERNKMRSVVIQNEKLASIGLLSAGVAHEINNPLAFVGNNLVVLQRDVQGLLALIDLFERCKERLKETDPPLHQAIAALEAEQDIAYTRDNLPRLLQRTRDGVDRVTRIVQSLRGLARTDAPKRHEVSLPDLIDNSLEILRGRFKRSGIEVRQDHDANPRLTCVSTQISQVILNLLVNAFQALEAHGKEGGRIEVRTQREGEQMLLEVRDNGPGILPEHVRRLFDPFFTTKDVGEGTGLGLSICHNIVTAHGGSIEVESPPGQGACFRVYLPLKPALVKDRAPAPGPLGETLGKEP
ncbi:MAG: PAS domain S-box protein [Gemmataceae bacterium]